MFCFGAAVARPAREFGCQDSFANTDRAGAASHGPLYLHGDVFFDSPLNLAPPPGGTPRPTDIGWGGRRNEAPLRINNYHPKWRALFWPRTEATLSGLSKFALIFPIPLRQSLPSLSGPTVEFMATCLSTLRTVDLTDLDIATSCTHFRGPPAVETRGPQAAAPGGFSRIASTWAGGGVNPEGFLVVEMLISTYVYPLLMHVAGGDLAVQPSVPSGRGWGDRAPFRLWVRKCRLISQF